MYFMWKKKELILAICYNLQVLTVDRFIVTRRVYVETLYVRNAKKRWSKGMLPADINMLIGK